MLSKYNAFNKVHGTIRPTRRYIALDIPYKRLFLSENHACLKKMFLSSVYQALRNQQSALSLWATWTSNVIMYHREDKVRILKRGIKNFSNFYDSIFNPFFISFLHRFNFILRGFVIKWLWTVKFWNDV